MDQNLPLTWKTSTRSHGPLSIEQTHEALRADKQKERAARLLDDPANTALRLTHGAYRKIVRCYAQEDKRKGRGIALGFRSLDNYVTRSLLHTGGFRHAIQAHL